MQIRPNGGAGTELLRAGTHGVLNGAVNSIEGKNFGAGFVSGAAASLLASGTDALGAGYGGMVASSMVGGSIGSALMGGSWVEGAFTGVNIAMYNHGWKYINGEWVYELDEVVVKPLHATFASYKPIEPGLQAVSPEFDLLFGGGGIIGMVKNIFSSACKLSANPTGFGFKTFRQFKKVFGSAESGMNWHHIVEQTPSNIKSFGPEKIHNLNNLVQITGGKGSLHAKISGHYSSKPQDLHGLTVRQWLSTKSFEEQYEYGIKTLKIYGWE